MPPARNRVSASDADGAEGFFMQRVSMRKRLRVDHRQKWRWLSLLEPHRESCRPVGDRRANVLTANCATQALQLHQPSDRAACHRNAFPAHLLPDLRHAADRPVDLPDTLALRLQDLIAFGASAAFGRITKLRSMASVARRRNRFDCRPLRRVLATLLAYQAHCALPDFRGKLARLLVHGSILSRVGASTKLGAVHTAVLQPSLKRVVHRVAVALLN
ncbi:hypothetical protein DO72_2400 [Burkholderia pseudomallei]|nr:hypothetical protein DO72_2400 [Burkholderia pseudomallei]